jgi:hypothetical protein
MYRQKDDSIVRSCQFRFVTPTQSICVKSDQRDLSYLPGQIEEPQRKVPPRTAGRTVFLTLNATAKRLPIAIHKSAKSELERLFGFVARGGGRRMAVQWARTRMGHGARSAPSYGRRSSRDHMIGVRERSNYRRSKFREFFARSARHAATSTTV